MDILITLLLSAVKFGMTFPLAIMEFHFSFFQTILWINVGGILGIFFFAYLSEGINRWLKKIFRRKRRPADYGSRTEKKKKEFTRRNRKLIRIKQKYGLIGIALSTPLLLSIPIGVFLTVRYYPGVKARLFYLVGANLIWSFIYTLFYWYWNDLLFIK